MTIDKKQFEFVCRNAREAMLLQTSADALEWDERTGMPIEAGGYRAEQVARLRAMAHMLRIDANYGDALSELRDQITGEDTHGDMAATVSGLHRDWQRDAKLPTDLVESIASAGIRGQQNWDTARKSDDFSVFRDSLQTMVSLKREVGQRLAEGTDKSIYETLMDEYEPDARVNEIEAILGSVREPLVGMLSKVENAPKKPDVSCLRRSFPVAQQRDFCRSVAQAVGFDFRAGRLDETSHPFCTTLGPRDVRILTRYDEHWLPGGLYGTLHEVGHGLYEQGLRSEWFGLPPGSYVSLGFHESQSRLWENQVARSRAFCQWLHPRAAKAFAPKLDDVSIDDFFAAVNRVQPSLIRVEADEMTYNLHIIIRFELERHLISGELSVDDLPDAWRERYASDLGVTPPSDADGVLQDVHWAAGLFGYFPTYTLGNVIAAQLFAGAEREIGDLQGMFANGEFLPLLDWLRSNVHHPGRSYRAAALVEKVTGEPLNADHLIRYLETKLAPIYGLD